MEENPQKNELEQFKILVALEMRKALHTQLVMGAIGMCSMFAIIFLYVSNRGFWANLTTVFVLIYLGFIMVMAQKKIVYLTKKYNLPQSKIFNFKLEKNE